MQKQRTAMIKYTKQSGLDGLAGMKGITNKPVKSMFAPPKAREDEELTTE